MHGTASHTRQGSEVFPGKYTSCGGHSIAFVTNVVSIVTHGGIELMTHVLSVRMLNRFPTAPLHGKNAELAKCIAHVPKERLQGQKLISQGSIKENKTASQKPIHIDFDFSEKC